jgi:hypothetical protein
MRRSIFKLYRMKTVETDQRIYDQIGQGTDLQSVSILQIP